MNPHPSRLRLDQHLLSPSPDITEHARDCARCRDYLADANAEDRRFLSASAPPRRLAPGWLLLPIAAALIFVATPRYENRTKGDATRMELAVWRQNAPASPPYRAGDQLNFRYASPHKYLLLVSLEADGDIGVLIAQGDQSAPLAPTASLQTLPLGVQLDANPLPERIFAWVSDEPLAVEAVVARLRARYWALGPPDRQTLPIQGVVPGASEHTWYLERQ